MTYANTVFMRKTCTK